MPPALRQTDFIGERVMAENWMNGDSRPEALGLGDMEACDEKRRDNGPDYIIK